jgi:cytochrome P450
MSAASDRPLAMPAGEIDLTDRALFRQGFPHALFTRLRREAPVLWHPAPQPSANAGDEGFWLLSKHEDVQAANRDSELFSALDGPMLQIRPAQSGRVIIAMDGAPHIRIRKLINAGFTPRMVGRLEEQARRWAAAIVEEALERSTCNFVDDVAYKLPMHMIADIVGIPVGDRDELFRLTCDLMQCPDPEYSVPVEQRPAIEKAVFDYAQRLGAEKRRNPQDDIWTLLNTVEVETDDGKRTRLGELELDLFFMILILAGSETTRNAITSGLLALVDNPGQLASLRENPAAMPGAVEEILRWSSPVAYFARRATRDTQIRGVRIAAGDRVTLWYPSANRDEEVFEDPFRFDISRGNPRSHVTFGGGGAHYCLGANLARREIAIMFEEFLARVGGIEILGEPSYSVVGIASPVPASLNALPVRLTPH